MTYGALSPQDFAAFDRVERPRKPISQAKLCAAVLVLSAAAGLPLLYGRHDAEAPVAAIEASSAPTTSTDSATLPALPQIAARRSDKRQPARRYAGMYDPRSIGGSSPATFAQSAPLRSRFEPLRQSTTAPMPFVVASAAPQPVSRQPDVAANVPTPPAQPLPAGGDLVEVVPMPAPRPAFLSGPVTVSAARTPAETTIVRRVAKAEAPAPVAPGASSDAPSFLEKLFGKSQSQPSSGTALAYAAPGAGGGFFGAFAQRPVGNDGYTAVYDISAHTVILPDGTQLEAHSGLGAIKDDPRGVTEHMRGATPPNVYDLSLREAPFHGVRALRLTPTGGTTYGREGLLAHTYMLRGRSGESNGCVVFRDYAAFLRAYESGAIRRLAVVASR